MDSKEAETEKNVVFGNCNAFQRKLIYQVIQRDFQKQITATSRTMDNQKVIVIERKWSTDRQKQEVEQQNQDDEREYRRLVGLSALLLKISQSVSVPRTELCCEMILHVVLTFSFSFINTEKADSWPQYAHGFILSDSTIFRTIGWIIEII